MTSRSALLITGCAAVALANPDRFAGRLARGAPETKVRAGLQKSASGDARFAIADSLDSLSGGLSAASGSSTFSPRARSAAWGASAARSSSAAALQEK
jgi:hypothetical protein